MSTCYRIAGNRRDFTPIRAAALLIAVLLTTPAASFAQQGVPEFEVDAVASRPAGYSASSRVDVYLRIPYEHLSFINSVDGFTAGYSVTVEAVSDNDDRLTSVPVQSRIWEGSVRVPTYQGTKETNLSTITTQSLDLPPGSYRLAVQVEDQNSSQVFVRELPIKVRDLNRPFAISDITLVDEYDESTLGLIPRTSGLIGTDEEAIDLFFETYASRDSDLQLRYHVTRTAKDGGVPAGSPWSDAADADIGESVVDRIDAVASRTGRSQHVVNLPVDEVKVGTYMIRVTLEDNLGTVLDETTRLVKARWNGLTAHIQDIDVAIEQLEYTAKKREMSFMREAESPSERFDRFRSFWEKRDPSPGTMRNEAMEEYYYRVNFANRRYGTSEDGWKTDRGFVLVRYGEPDHIQHRTHSFDYDPYEIWVYERIGRQFVFVDKTGFGDYQLLVPVWDERTRLY